jgi:hypothetical protein
MTTIVVHGTLAAAEDWYWDSWYEGGFCHSLANAMLNTTGDHDVWTVDGVSVEEVPEINPERSMWSGRIGQISQRNGYFIWSGDYAAISRKMAGNDLAKYLNALSSATAEPIRVIAHSHGCNIVKHASSSSKLANDVYIESAAFLACPHMTDADSGKMLYRLNPSRFGRIGNFYSERDVVVRDIANKLATASGWNLEVPDVSFVDDDPESLYLYEDFNMNVPDNVKGSAVHSWLHSADMGYTVGRWLETGE